MPAVIKASLLHHSTVILLLQSTGLACPSRLLLQQIKDFGRVAAHLGHSSVDTTRKGYAQLAADDLKDVLAGW